MSNEILRHYDIRINDNDDDSSVKHTSAIDSNMPNVLRRLADWIEHKDMWVTNVVIHIDGADMLNMVEEDVSH